MDSIIEVDRHKIARPAKEVFSKIVLGDMAIGEAEGPCAMRITDLRIYPIKSCRGVSLDEVQVEARGLRGDRRAMIVNSEGRFLSQRTHPKLAQIDVSLIDEMELNVGGDAVIASFSSERTNADVWHDTVSACVADAEVNAQLSDFLQEPVKLVRLDDHSMRQSDSRFGAPSQVSFADGFPLLITTTASLRALGQAAGDDIPMDRFRPNIVVDTLSPWEEDAWNTLQIDGQRIDIVKPCTRCVMTTLDQATGAQVGQSTMQALIKTRGIKADWGSGVVFGVNAIARPPFTQLSVGMQVDVAA